MVVSHTLTYSITIHNDSEAFLMSSFNLKFLLSGIVCFFYVSIQSLKVGWKMPKCCKIELMTAQNMRKYCLTITNSYIFKSYTDVKFELYLRLSETKNKLVA